MTNSIRTKKVLAAGLKKRMVSTPFAKISVGDITKECGMNRNSFYYHFKDKYELLNWIFLTEVTAEINHEEAVEMSGWQIIERVSGYFYCNRAFYANAMSYEGQNSFVEYSREFLETLIRVRSESMFENEDPDFLQFFIDFFADATARAIARWIKEGAKYPPEQFMVRIKKAATGVAIKILQDK